MSKEQVNKKEEIEKKFLVTSSAWKRGATGHVYRQGYLSIDRKRTVRIRVVGEQGVLTIKGERIGDTAPEFEYPIPVADARTLLDTLCLRPLIEKTRYTIDHKGHTWEVDAFHGDNEGLVVAEIELTREGEPFERPEWIGEEVTKDFRYTNANLVDHPYATWKETEK
jgi:CYTH domain-containing protein